MEGFLKQETKGTHHKGKDGKFGYIKIILKCVFIERYFKENEMRNHKTNVVRTVNKQITMVATHYYIHGI